MKHFYTSLQLLSDLIIWLLTDGDNTVGIGKSAWLYFQLLQKELVLFSAFAVLYSFQLRNLLKGIGQQMKWSVRDESLTQ